KEPIDGISPLRRPAAATALVLLACLGVARPARAADVGRLMSRANERGTVRVLARLEVPATPKRLAGSDVDAARLTAIRASRARLARDLEGTAWRTSRDFSTIPYVALELSPEALTKLTQSGA